eukprot:1459300-Rhodomonas_salina.1
MARGKTCKSGGARSSCERMQVGRAGPMPVRQREREQPLRRGLMGQDRSAWDRIGQYGTVWVRMGQDRSGWVRTEGRGAADPAA